MPITAEWFEEVDSKMVASLFHRKKAADLSSLFHLMEKIRKEANVLK